VTASERINHLLVDEYQDLNACDLAIVQRLTASGVELYVAGDDDQSIYGFRYANPQGIRRFHREFRPSEPLELEECQRCDRRILDLALYVARQDPRRIPKRLTPRRRAGTGEVQILRFLDQRREADGIASVCEWLVGSQDMEPQGILVLLRTDRNRQFSTPIRTALTDRGLPVATVANPLAPLDEIEGRHFLCLLRLIDNPRDRLAWRTLLEIRRNGIGVNAFATLYDLARVRGQSFFRVLSSINGNPSLMPRGGNNIRDEFRSIRRMITSVSEEDFSNLSTLLETLGAEHIDDEEERSEVLAVFHRVLQEGTVENLNQLLRAINVSLYDSEQERERLDVLTL
jgi:DNA helicase-2/ATP-dependent DNA helicase PcrA